MEAVFDQFLKSPYPIVAFVTVVCVVVFRAIRKSWPGFSKFVKDSVNSYFATEKERIEANVEMGLQLKDMIATQTALQADLRDNAVCRAKIDQVLEEVSHKVDALLQGTWEQQKTLKAYFKKTDIIWSQIGIVKDETNFMV